METDTDYICSVCSESKDPRKARHEYRRLGLDEPPEPVLCKCRDVNDTIALIDRRTKASIDIVATAEGMSMQDLTDAYEDAAVVIGINYDRRGRWSCGWTRSCPRPSTRRLRRG